MDTTHNFIPSPINSTLCAVCYLPLTKHQLVKSNPTITNCESCNSDSKLRIMNGMWLCESCFSRELETPSQKIPQVIAEPKSVLTEVTDELNKPIGSPDSTSARSLNELEHSTVDRLGYSAIKTAEDFFNVQMKSIAARWAEIVADDNIPVVSDKTSIPTKHEQLAIEVKALMLHDKKHLFEAMQSQLEHIEHLKASQVYMNQLAGKLREEFRVKLKMENLDYIPASVPKNAPKAIKLDKSAAGLYAKAMGISKEQAQRIIDNKFKEVTGLTCTCQETPGICRVHSK